MNNCPIKYVYLEPAYYDGVMQKLITDPNTNYYDGAMQKLITDPNTKYYNVLGLEFVSSGDKIVLHSIELGNIFLDDPDAIVKYDSEYSEKHYSEWVEKTRKEMIDINAEVDGEKNNG